MFTAMLLQSILTVAVFFFFLMLCARKELALDKSLAVSGLWTALFIIFWHDLHQF